MVHRLQKNFATASYIAYICRNNLKPYTLQTMRLIIEKNYDQVSQWAANYVAARINEAKPTAEHPFVLGCPTGSSPLGMYRALIKLNKEGKVSFKNVVTFNMDEYCGIPRDHEQSYYTFMWTNFFNQIDILPENVNILNGKQKTPLPNANATKRKLLRTAASTSSLVVWDPMGTLLSTSRVHR